MRISKAALIMLCLVAGLAAQTARQFVRPLPGQTPPYNLGIKADGLI